MEENILLTLKRINRQKKLAKMKRHEKIWRLQNSQGAWKHAKCNTLSLIIYHRFPKLKIWLQRLIKTPQNSHLWAREPHRKKEAHNLRKSS